MTAACCSNGLQAIVSNGLSPLDVDVSQRRNIAGFCSCRSYDIPVHALVADVIERVGRIHDERSEIEAQQQWKLNVSILNVNKPARRPASSTFTGTKLASFHNYWLQFQPLDTTSVSNFVFINYYVIADERDGWMVCCVVVGPISCNWLPACPCPPCSPLSNSLTTRRAVHCTLLLQQPLLVIAQPRPINQAPCCCCVMTSTNCHTTVRLQAIFKWPLLHNNAKTWNFFEVQTWVVVSPSSHF